MNELEEIKDKIDIVELISSYINVKKAGQNYKALCPFHKEKTPSFMISPSKQIWHCFGCSKGGDVFGFIMNMEGMEFGEALRFLAKKAGVFLQKPTYGIQENTNQKSLLFELNNLAASFYHKILEESPEAQIARDYLQKRKVDKNAIMEFHLGYAPESFDKLINFLEGKGYRKEDIIKAGLAVKKDNGRVVDRFYKRLMFPIINPSGAVLGFTGRILTDEKVSKYINTPETLIYEKSRVLFGLDKAKKAILEKGWAVIVEGNMDVLASWEAGVENAVASSGTALTIEQLKVIKRYTPNIILALDKDEAGSEALKRGIFVALEEGINIKVADLGRFKDPDEMIKTDKNSWKKTLKNSEPFVDFYFAQFFDKIKGTEQDVTFKKKVASIILPFLKRMQNSIEQAHYIKVLAKKLNVPESSIADALRRVKVEKQVSREKVNESKSKKSTEKLLIETLLGLIFTFPVTISEFASLLDSSDFKDQNDKKIFAKFKKTFEKKGDFNIDDLEDEELKSQASELIFVAEENHKDSDNEEIIKEAKFCFKRLKELRIKEAKEEIKTKIEKAEQKDDNESLNKLVKELQELLNKEKEIKEF